MLFFSTFHSSKNKSWEEKYKFWQKYQDKVTVDIVYLLNKQIFIEHQISRMIME